MKAAIRLFGVAIASALALNTAALGQANVIWPNDECAFATPISGNGAWPFDSSSAFVSTSLPVLTSCTDCTCSLPFVGIENDIWYVWTASCTGLAEIKTGVTTDPSPQCNVDTVLAVYNTPCPNATTLPLACCDDTCATLGNTCDLASFVRVQVECGQQYLIRVGRKTGTPGGYGTLKISCQGMDCPEVALGDCPDCCGAKPTYNDPAYSANYTGQVAVMTGNDDAAGPTFTNVVTIFNLACSSPPPTPGVEWNPVPGPPSTAFRYSRNDWTKIDMGSVFGVTLDDVGGIAVTHASFYGILYGGPSGCGPATAIGSLPGSSSTSIYRIAPGTGTPSVLANLPGGSSDPKDPGLGNIAYDCEHEEYFVSHFGDGRIYRVSPTGTVLGWYDHATNTSGLGAIGELPPHDYRQFVPLGERVWAVKARNGRLYYSVWGQNPNGFPPSSVVGTTPNRVWSIAIGAGAGGDFVLGTRQQEVQPAVHPGNSWASFSTVQFSSPISDISFSPTCRMLLAERDVSGDECTLAHSARALEYGIGGGAWVPTNYRGGMGYEIGANVFSAFGTNSSGGCDYDYAPVDTCAAGRLWVTGDAVYAPTVNTLVYGMTGIPTTTANGHSQGLHVDYSGTYPPSPYDKTKQGDVAVPCALAEEPCLNISNQKIDCPIDDPVGTTGCYTWTFNITNKTAFSIKYITIPLHPVGFPNITINPNVINLFLQDGSLLDPGETTTISVEICGGTAGDEFCIDLALVTSAFEECCFEEVCIELPACDCGQLRDQHIKNLQCDASPDGTGTVASFTYCFTLDNLTAHDKTQVIFIPADSRQAYFAKDFFFLPPLVAGGSIQMCVQVVNAVPGEEFCFFVLLQHPGSDCCCAFEKCIQVPACPSNANICDLNGDHIVDGADLGILLASWGPCPVGMPCPGDFNNDGQVDGADLGVLLARWSG